MRRMRSPRSVNMTARSRLSLLRVPFESEGHRENYVFGDLLGMRLTECKSAAGPIKSMLTRIHRFLFAASDGAANAELRADGPVSCICGLGRARSARCIAAPQHGEQRPNGPHHYQIPQRQE